GIDQGHTLFIGCRQQPHDGPRSLGIRGGLALVDFQIVAHPADALFKLTLAEHHKWATHTSGCRGVQRVIDDLHGRLGILTTPERVRTDLALCGSHQIEAFTRLIRTSPHANRRVIVDTPLTYRTGNETMWLIGSRIGHTPSLGHAQHVTKV